MIIRDVVKDRQVKVYDAESNGDPHSHVDIVILGEGYTIDEKVKFEKDLKHFSDLFFSQEPYKTYADKFNIHGVYRFFDVPANDLFVLIHSHLIIPISCLLRRIRRTSVARSD